MKVIELAFSCYPVTDVARSRAFYEGLLGLKPTMDHATDSAHWIEYDISGGTLAIGSAPGWNASDQACSVGLEVDDFDIAVAELRAANVPFKVGPMETPVCHMAFVGDPDGNSVGIDKRKPGHH
jgi:catechol 2,3-dioxygenase-like lactoylglutathione lyase family enzyme